MKVVFDIEANGLEDPTKVWLIVCKDIDTNEYYIFRNLEDVSELSRFTVFASGVELFIGHNILGYDIPVMERILGIQIEVGRCLDTLIVSKLVDYSRSGHSIEDYGVEFGKEKGNFTDFSAYSQAMEDYCIRDVDICHLVFDKYRRYINNPERARSIALEHNFQLVVNDLHANGFALDVKKATTLLGKVEAELAVLDKDILDAFPPREVLIREFTPRATKFGTISKTSVPRSLWDRLSDYEIGQTYRHTREEPFNPSSHKQIIGVLNEAGWSPVDRTKTHIDAERERNKLNREARRNSSLDIKVKELDNKLEQLRKTGWKVNETNLDTLPSSAPKPIRSIANRIILEARRRTLTEWLNLVREDGRIHGKFYGIGAWTHRMAHQNPNTANIPNEFDITGKKKLYGKELRALWVAPKNRLLVGCDAEGIQLRIFAHYIDDPEFTKEVISGDVHTLNQSILGSACRTRDAAKRFIYAMLLGAGLGKLAEILDCNQSAAEQALARLIDRYQGFATLKETIIPADAKRGWFVGLDGRAVRIPGEDVGSRRHLAMSGYLQNGEAVIMKMATLRWLSQMRNAELWEASVYSQLQQSFLVNFVHDEWQTECPNDMKIALTIAQMQADSLRKVGEELKLKCPLAGSFWNKKAKDYTIDTNWSKTH